MFNPGSALVSPLARIFSMGVHRSIPMLILCIIDLAAFSLVSLCAFLLVIILPPVYGHAQILYYLAFAFPLSGAWAALFLSTLSFGSGDIIRSAVIGNLTAIFMMAMSMICSCFFYVFEMPNFVDCVRSADNLKGASHIICVDQIVGAWFLMIGLVAVLPVAYLLSSIVRTVDTFLMLSKAGNVPMLQATKLLDAKRALFLLPGWGGPK